MQLSYNNKFKPKGKALFNMRRAVANASTRTTVVALGAVVAVVFLVANLSWTSTSNYFNAGKHPLIKYHGFWKKDLIAPNEFIYPNIEDTAFLKELTIDGIFDVKTDSVTGDKFYYEFEHKSLDSLNSIDEELKQITTVKTNFFNHGKFVFNPKLVSPEIVLVTALDYEKYDQAYLTKILENRLNYARSHGYGVFMQWLQQYVPLIKDFQNNRDWAKLFLLRNAMYAFPNAKYFWFLEENSLIMRYDIELFKYLLNPSNLDAIMMRDHPIIPPNGIIHTFKNTKAENVNLMLTQFDSHLNLDSFIIKNSLNSKILIEFWSNPLFRSYHNFPNHEESALQHILQWHPTFLAHTAIIPPRSIASSYTDPAASADDITYAPGDFVVNFRDCAARKTCEAFIDKHYALVQ